MKEIEFCGDVYKVHPYYCGYAASDFGCIIDIKGNVLKKIVGDDNFCYVDLDLRGLILRYGVQSFVWECFNGIISSNCVVRDCWGRSRVTRLNSLRLLKKCENGKIFRFHPFHGVYSTDFYDNIYDINKKILIKKKDKNGYYFVNLIYGRGGTPKYYVHEFIWECHNGIKPKDGVIEHINGNKKDNFPRNLRLVQQNSQK